jgi:Sulfatase
MKATQPSRLAVLRMLALRGPLLFRPVALWFARRPTLVFVLIWLIFDVLLNARYPGEEPAFWYLVPSTDVIVIFLLFLLGGQFNWQLPRALRGALVAWCFVVRFLRFGDGLQLRYYNQPFSLYTDLALVPELVRFAFATLRWWQFGLLAIGVVALLAGFFIGCYRALGYAERYLHGARNGLVFGALAGAAFVVTWLTGHAPQYAELYRGGFAASAVPRVRHELQFLLNVYWKQADEARIIARTEERLASTPADLAKLAGKNVHLILIESYGQTVLERPLFVDSVRATFDSFESELGARGYSIVSDVLDSPTYGGHSWLAHATLGTGIRTANQLDYQVVCAKKPKAIARFFHEAGYRTVVLQPGTTRPWPNGEFFGFDQKYYLWNFDYVGPTYAWATMPDQYVLDFARRRELSPARGPLFIEYILVSSHAPWSDLPPLIDDWSRVQNGDIYNHIEATHYPIVWPTFTNASGAYIDSIKYDFEVLKRYLSDYIKDDSLVIILGDHQPVAEVNGHSPLHGVPVHILSRDPKLLEPFIARGYTAGLRPHRTGNRPGLEQFLPDFLEDFSSASAKARSSKAP